MKALFAITAGLLLLTSPVLAGPRHWKHMHRHAARSHGTPGNSVVSSGSDIRITSSGEVIGPKTAIVSVPKQPPQAPLSKTQGDQPPVTPAVKP